MFPLGERARRFCCRVLFCLLCLFPTGATLAWCAWSNRASQRVDWEQSLAAHLGLVTHIERISHPRPGLLRCEGLELSDPETSDRLVTISRLDADRWGGKLVLRVQQGTVSLARPDELWRVLRRALAGRTSRAAPPVRWSCGDVVVQSSSAQFTLTELTGGIESVPSRETAYGSFRVVGVDMPEPACVRIQRDRQGASAVTAVTFHSGTAALPTALVFPGLQAPEQLGPEGAFRGYVWASFADGSWSGELTGQLSRLDLRHLATQHLPHTLSGTAEAVIERLNFRGGRIEEAVGTLIAGPGSIGRSLLDSARTALALRYAARIDTAPSILPYEQLALAYSLDSSGITLKGSCQGATAGVLLADSAGPLLGEPDRPRDVAALVRALAPDGDSAIPFGRQAERLVRVLPLASPRIPVADTSGHR